MPPSRSARKLQPHIVLDDIFKNNTHIANRKNIVTALGPPWARRFSADSNEKTSDIPQRTINLRSRGIQEVIVIEDENDILKTRRKPVETKDSDAARTRGFTGGRKRKIEPTFECLIKTENCSNEPDLMIIQDNTAISKLLIQCQPVEIIPGVITLGEYTPKTNKKLANSQRKVDIEHRSALTVTDENVPKTPTESTTAVKKVATSGKKRGRPLGWRKNKKIVKTAERTIANTNSSYIDVIIVDDKKNIPKPEIQCKAEQSITHAAVSRCRLSKNDIENFVGAILKNKDDILEANGELVSERNPVWQRIRHELEYQVTARTLRRIAKNTEIYKMLTKQEQKVEPIVPMVNNVEVEEIAVIEEPNRDEVISKFDRALELFRESIDCLSNAIKEMRKEFNQQ